MPWAPASETDLYYAQMPFPEAQAKLGETGGGTGVINAVCGWHGASFDSALGSVALPDPSGTLADAFLGKRVQITAMDAGAGAVRSVFAYVYKSTDLSVGDKPPVAYNVATGPGRTVGPFFISSDQQWGINSATLEIDALNDNSSSSYIFQNTPGWYTYIAAGMPTFVGAERVRTFSIAVDTSQDTGAQMTAEILIDGFSRAIATITTVGAATTTLTYTPTVPLIPGAVQLLCTVTASPAGALSRVTAARVTEQLTPPFTSITLPNGIVEDISLPRRTFMELAPLSTTSLQTFVSICPDS